LNQGEGRIKEQRGDMREKQRGKTREENKKKGVGGVCSYM
jgi:hypothetical protein